MPALAACCFAIPTASACGGPVGPCFPGRACSTKGWWSSLVEPRRPDGAAGVDLTPREQEVLGLLAEGLSNKLIAARLGISEHTAKFHVNALLDKLGAETRTEAVVTAARRGLLMF